MKNIHLDNNEKIEFAQTSLEYRYDGQHVPILPESLLKSHRREDNANDLWTVYQRTQENIIRGNLPGRTTREERTRT